MNQDNIFSDSEGDNWFQRNKRSIVDTNRFDWPLEMVRNLKNVEEITSVLELGCSNGWRLDRIQDLRKGLTLYGIDASSVAIEDGKNRYKDLMLFQGSLSDIPLQIEVDLVIVNFVFHWVSRETLAKSVSEVDRVVKNNGMLIIGDFLPDFPQKRKYHHLPESNVFTFKQDYSRIFEALGTYKEVMRVTFNHDDPDSMIKAYYSNVRAYCAILHKSINNYYIMI